MKPVVFSVLAEIEWQFEGDDDVNWLFLIQHAAFTHKEACIVAYLEAKDAGAMRVLFWS